MHLGELTLPDFIVIGAQKAGTSSIHAVLKNHPAICMPRKKEMLKEIHFFNREANYQRGLKYYSGFFSHAIDSQLVGEVTPNYLYQQEAVIRIARDLPDIKLIACLREPVSRAYSQYWMNVLQNGLQNCFEEAISQNVEYLERGFYTKQLEHVLNYFRSERLHICFQEDLSTDPASFYFELFRFLGLDSGAIEESTTTKIFSGAVPRNQMMTAMIRVMGRGYRPLRRALGDSRFGELLTHTSKRFRAILMSINRADGTYPPMKEDTRRDLERLFRPENERLRRMLGRLPGAWGYPE